MQHTLTQSDTPSASVTSSMPRGMHLRGMRLVLAWLVLAAIALAYLIGFTLNLAAGQEQIALARNGITNAQSVLFFNGLECARMLVYTICALVIIWRQPRDLIALSTAVVLIAAGAVIPSASEALALNTGSALPNDFSNAVVAIMVLYLVFPDGRLAPRWGWLLVAIWVAWSWAILLAPGTLIDPATWPPRLQFARAMIWLACGLAAQLYRYRRVASPTQRQQTYWVLVGAMITFGAAIVYVAIPVLFPLLHESSTLFEQYAQLGGLLRTLLMLSLPLSMAVAVLRYRLWNVAPLLNRTLLYGALTLCVILIYGLIVGGLSLLFQTSANPMIALVATGVTAVLFQWLREQLQHTTGHH